MLSRRRILLNLDGLLSSARYCLSWRSVHALLCSQDHHHIKKYSIALFYRLPLNGWQKALRCHFRQLYCRGILWLNGFLRWFVGHHLNRRSFCHILDLQQCLTSWLIRGVTSRRSSPVLDMRHGPKRNLTAYHR